MNISERHEGDIVVLGPQGRIDNETSPAFQHKLRACLGAPDARVIVDFSGVEFISSAGLSALMAGADLAKETGGHLAVAGVRALVKEIFEISRFSLVVPIYATSQEALSALG